MNIRQEIRTFATWLVLVVEACFLCQALKADESDSHLGFLKLVNGDVFSGQLHVSDSGDRILWQNEHFLDPFGFQVAAIESIRFPHRLKVKPQDPFVIECVDGDILTGDIVGIDVDKVVLRSESLGELTIRMSSLRCVHRLRSGKHRLVTFVTGLSDWTSSGFPTENWIDEGEHLSTGTPGAMLNGDFSIPTRAVIDFELSWDGTPDFVFAIATDANRKDDSSTDGWRLETSNDQLVVVRETEFAADTDIVRDLTGSNSIRLFGYLDQQLGKLELHLQSGEKIAEVQIPGSAEGTVTDSTRGETHTGIRVVNRGSSLRLTRLRITPWVGPANETKAASTEPVQISDSRGEITTGKIQSFDAQTKKLTLVSGEKSFVVQLADLVSIQFANNPIQVSHPDSVFRLRGGTQVSGDVVQVGQHDWLIKGRKYIGQSSIPRSEVQHLAFNRSAEESKKWSADPGTEMDGHRVARIEFSTKGGLDAQGELPSSRHLGWIASAEADSQESTGTSAISWRPLASENACRLRPNASGRMVYDEGSRSSRLGPPGSRSARIARTVQRSGDQSFGELFLDSVDRVESRRARRDQHVVHLTSGDVIACRVESIDQSGVYISTPGQDNVLVAHDDMKAIELQNNSDLPKISDAKKDRLLTLPRLQKSSPPTHILCSSDGDLLRCRLLRTNQNKIEVEVQMETLTIQRQRVSHIIWLHPNQKASDVFDDRYTGQVQALWFDGRRLTFVPTKTSESNIEGTSKILGDCDIELNKIVQLTFGGEINRESTKLLYSNWKLSDAVQPLIMQNADDSDSATEASELVGQTAPRIVLERLDGGSFDLDTYRGRIVVLDFWASWRAPCIRWMPQLHEAISAYDPNKVALVGINLEERREAASDALKRLGIQMVVALDVDGVTSGPYQASAIPQTVVVGPNGNVISVIVGGDRSAVGKVTKVIDELIDSQQ